MKKSHPGAREAIRWLEGQFRRGNRWVRAQRAKERATLPRLKYPRKRHKDEW